VEHSLSRQRPHAGQTGEHNLRCQFRFLVLQVGFALLQSMPGLVQAFGSRKTRLYLQFQFDALPPEEFAPLNLGMAGLSVILVLVMALVVLVVSLIAMGVLLIGHEKTSFPGAGCSVHRERSEQHANRQNQPLMVLTIRASLYVTIDPSPLDQGLAGISLHEMHCRGKP